MIQQKLEIEVRPDRLPGGVPEWEDHEPGPDDRSKEAKAQNVADLVYVAMSGGVDSSMAAALLKQKVEAYVID